MMLKRTKLILLLNFTYVCWAYDPRRLDGPFVNGKHKRYSSSFHSDEQSAPYLGSYNPFQHTINEEIAAYLPLYEREMMIWRCCDAIQPYWDGRVIPVVELYCEVIGILESVQWLHKGEGLLKGDGKYTQQVFPHYANGRFFNRWLDFTLHIHNATQADSGVYYFRACALDGDTERQQIHVDIS